MFRQFSNLSADIISFLALALPLVLQKQVYYPGFRTSASHSYAVLFPLHPSLSLTLWYPRHKLQTRISIFSASGSLAGAFSGLLAYAIGFMSGIGGNLGWSWIFVRNFSKQCLLG